MEHVLIVALAGVLWGWLWCAPGPTVLDPFRDWWRTYLDQQVAAEALPEPVWVWLRHRFSCPICVGFDATVAAHLMLTGWNGWDSVASVAAANGAHVAWMTWLNREVA